MEFWVYVIKNTVTLRIYIGQTNDIKARLERHNKLKLNKQTSYTSKNKGQGEWILVYCEKFVTRGEAMKREKELKSYKGREFIKSQLSW